MRLITGRRIFPLLLSALFLSSGQGQSPTVSPASSSAKAAISFPSEPTGASRCAVCHASEVEGYARSAMGHSLRRAGQEPTGTVTTPDAKITMYSSPAGSWQRLEAGGDISNYKIEYVIGSGNHATGYLVDIDGHLFQSPVAFYKSRNSYDLAPGYEKTKDPDFTRPVAEGCVFCHAGTELHVTGTTNQFRSPVFPDEAITCERCHGPSEKHLAEPRAGTIVNPAKLELGARDSVCEQCHLLGAARVPNPGREFRDFQPGQRLESTFTTYRDALPPDSPPEAFKVISHVEQLAMSVCARSSQGRLWCGTCHDPHNKPVEPVQYYRSRCLSCHTGAFPSSHPAADSDCIHCHMPRRDAQDGGHTAFTDHRIQRRPQSQSDLPSAGDIAAWREPAPDLQKRNLGIAYINAGFQRRSSTFIVKGYRLLTEVQQQFALDPETFTWMGTALLVGKHPSEAELAYERVLALDPNSAAAETNVAFALQQTGDIDGTITHLERAVAIDPLHLQASSLLINLYRQQGNTVKADALSDKIRAIMEQQPTSGEGISSQPKPASALTTPGMAETVFKNIKVLQGIPADQVIPTMRFITSALGVGCNYCHVEGHFEDDAKKPKQIARSMMQMMAAINRNDFEGAREVTCYSCHHGEPKPLAVPLIAGETPAPQRTESSASILKEGQIGNDLPTADQLIDKFIQALGGTAALEKISSRVANGNAQVNGKSIRVELFDKAPDKSLFIQHTPAGDSRTVIDGSAGWASVPGRPTHDLSSSDLDADRMDADLQFALHVKQLFPDLRVQYPETINGREAYAFTGIRKGSHAPWKFFFDAQSGLLVRVMRYADSPLGLDPTQIDYGDYRTVDGVQMPFLWTIARPGAEARVQIQMEDIRQNVPIDDAQFQIPPPKQK
ncbi:MAG: c-type cytochrome [Candidatus Sulfotelmatobacter sp.]